MIDIKEGMRVKNHLGAKGMVIRVASELPWGFPIHVIVIEQHPLYDLGEIDQWRRQDVKPILRISGVS